MIEINVYSIVQSVGIYFYTPIYSPTWFTATIDLYRLSKTRSSIHVYNHRKRAHSADFYEQMVYLPFLDLQTEWFYQRVLVQRTPCPA